MTTVEIAVNPAYKVHIGPGLLGQAGQMIRQTIPSRHTVIVTETNVAPLYLETLKKSLEKQGIKADTYIFPAGEESKNWTRLGDLLEYLMEAGLTRSDYLIALGGGVTGDLTGFAASIYLRGIPFVQIPTTLLAAVDSSVGGKTAVDLANGKNQVGTFWQPSLVLMDTDTLKTLPEEVRKDGLAESIKYGIIGDSELFRRIADGEMDTAPEELIAQCIRMKGEFVAEDEHDHGARQFLNLGHTFAHGIEACSRFAVSHGHAVAIGMCMAADAAMLPGMSAENDLGEIRRAIAGLGLPTECPYTAEEMAPWFKADKKRRGSELTLVLPRLIGDCELVTIPLRQTADLLRDIL